MTLRRPNLAPGLVLYAFTNAIYNLAEESRFEDAIFSALLAEGDTDTNACIVGGMVGAYGVLGSLPNYTLSQGLKCDISKDK
jgi:ADP-ribosyl-[dinitrogen reductase] hydrolase